MIQTIEKASYDHIATIENTGHVGKQGYVLWNHNDGKRGDQEVRYINEAAEQGIKYEDVVLEYAYTLKERI